MRLAVTIDIENDEVSTADERNRLSFAGIDLLPALRDELARHGLRATWFVRADDQLAELYGRCDYLLVEHGSLWRSFVARGDELAWHPHLYTRGSDGRFAPQSDAALAAAQLRRVHAALLAAGHRFAAVRLGEAVGAQPLAAAIDEAGLRADSSAIPGRRRHDSSRAFDWGTTPNRPFRPSVADYRVPGEPRRSFWQIPMTTAPVSAPHESQPLLRYLNLAYRPEVFAAALDAWQREATLVTILHPDELLAHPRPHPLYSFAFAALGANLERLASLGAECVTISELVGALDKENA